MSDGSETEKTSWIKFPSEMRLSRTWDDAFERLVWSSAMGIGTYHVSHVWCRGEILSRVLVTVSPSHKNALFIVVVLNQILRTSHMIC